LRTFPKELAAFRTIVEERGAGLRQLPFVELKKSANQPVEQLMVGPRNATIGHIVRTLSNGSIQIVIQGFLEHRFMPGRSVAMDGFYKYPDETIAPMEDFTEFD
jgi:hypothetical protein